MKVLVPCKNISYEKAQSLMGHQIVLKEKSTQKEIPALVRDTCFPSQSGLIVSFKKEDVKGLIKKYHMLPNERSKSLVDCDLRDIFKASSGFSLVEDVKNIYFSKVTNGSDINVGDFLFFTKNNMNGYQEIRGIDEVVSIDRVKKSFVYAPVRNRSQRFDFFLDAITNDKFEVFVVHGADFTFVEKLYKTSKDNLSVLPDYFEDFASLFKIPQMQVEKIVKTQLSSGVGLINFINILNKNMKDLNSYHFRTLDNSSNLKSSFSVFFETGVI